MLSILIRSWTFRLSSRWRICSCFICWKWCSIFFFSIFISPKYSPKQKKWKWCLDINSFIMVIFLKINILRCQIWGVKLDFSLYIFIFATNIQNSLRNLADENGTYFYKHVFNKNTHKPVSILDKTSFTALSICLFKSSSKLFTCSSRSLANSLNISPCSRLCRHSNSFWATRDLPMAPSKFSPWAKLIFS